MIKTQNNKCHSAWPEHIVQKFYPTFTLLLLLEKYFSLSLFLFLSLSLSSSFLLCLRNPTSPSWLLQAWDTSLFLCLLCVCRCLCLLLFCLCLCHPTCPSSLFQAWDTSRAWLPSVDTGLAVASGLTWVWTNFDLSVETFWPKWGQIWVAFLNWWTESTRKQIEWFV